MRKLSVLLFIILIPSLTFAESSTEQNPPPAGNPFTKILNVFSLDFAQSALMPSIMPATMPDTDMAGSPLEESDFKDSAPVDTTSMDSSAPEITQDKWWEKEDASTESVKAEVDRDGEKIAASDTSESTANEIANGVINNTQEILADTTQLVDDAQKVAGGVLDNAAKVIDHSLDEAHKASLGLSDNNSNNNNSPESGLANTSDSPSPPTNTLKISVSKNQMSTALALYAIDIEKNADKAISLMDVVNKKSPEFAPAYYVKALALNKKGNQKLAAQMMDKAKSLDPSLLVKK